MEKKTVLTIVNVNEALPPIGSDVLISYDNGLTFPEEAQYSENRTCMLAGVGGSNVYFGKGWATNGSTCCGKGLILDPPTHWLKEQTAITISEEEAKEYEQLKCNVDSLMLFCETNGDVVNGFKTRDIIQRLKQVMLPPLFRPIVDGWVDVKEHGLPKDNEDYQVWEKGAICPTIAHYLDKTYFVDNYDDENYTEEGWYYSFKYPFDDNIQHDDPLEVTHYCPLPTPPTSKG